MKKLIALFLMVCTIGVAAFAQKEIRKDKVKRTATVSQRAHNLFSKHKRYSGYKTKHKKRVRKEH